MEQKDLQVPAEWCPWALLDQLGCGGSNGAMFGANKGRRPPLFVTKHLNYTVSPAIL